MVLDDEASDTAMETKDGKVVVRKAGTDTVLAIVTVVDGDNLDIEIGGKKTRYVKSSKEEHQKLAAASPRERVIGFWKTHSRIDGQTVILEIGKDYISEDGKERMPMTREMEGGKLVLQYGKSQGLGAGSPPVVTFADDNHIEIASPWLGRNNYERVHPDMVARILAPTPDLVVGHWTSGDNVMELAPDSMNINGMVTPVTLVQSRKAVLGLDPQDSQKVLVRVRIEENGNITTDSGLMSERLEYARATQEEAKAKLDTLANMTRAVIGVWMSEKTESYMRGGREFMIIEPESFTRSGRTSPCVLRPVAGGVEIASTEQYRGPLARITYVDDNHIKTSGGMMSGDVTFVRTTRENMDLLLNPQPAQAEGYWVSEENNAWLPALNAAVITPDRLTWNGFDTPTEMEAKDGEVRIKDKAAGQIAARITFTGPNHISLQHAYSREAKPFRRASAEEVEAVLAAYRDGWGKTVGFWLSEKEYSGRKGGHQILEITPERAVFNSEKYSEYLPGYNNGRIYFTGEGNIEKYYGFVDLLDNGTINAEFRALDNGVFRRSSQEEVAELLTPNPERAFGYWLGESKNGAGLPGNLLAMGKNEINLNGERSAAHYASGDGRIVVETPDRNRTILRIRRLQADRLVVDGNINDTVYIRTTPEDFQKAWQEYGQQFQKNVYGYWKSRQVGGKPSVLLITQDRIVYNAGRPKENYRFGIRDGVFRLVFDSGTITIEPTGPNQIKYDHTGDFVRIDKDEYEQLLQLQK